MNMHIYMHMHVYTWTNFPHILPVNDKVCIVSYQYSNLKHLTIVEQSNSLQSWGSFLLISMNSIAFPPRQKANAESQ